jgi:AraC-like DNA-binding protein
MKGIGYYREDSMDMIEIKTCCDNLHAYKSHLHQELSIGYIQRGATILEVNGKAYHIKAGEAVIIYPFVSHKCQPIDINNWQFTMVYIDNTFCEGIFDHLTTKNAIGVKKLENDEVKQIQHLTDILKSNVSSFDREIELTNILDGLFRKCDIDIQLQSNDRINLVKKYIEDHFLEILQLKDMEEAFSMNRFSLIRNFKSKLNTTPNAYQLQLKVDYGKCLLKMSSDIVDIALRAGFYDQAHFTREFKKAYGITPLQYYKSIH